VGLIAGSLTTTFKQKIRAIETKCIGGLGDDACSFDIERR
jgi:predicted hydrocarbon binding protein